MSDEVKRWTIQRTHAFMTRNEVWGPLVEAGTEVEVVPATELDRLEAKWEALNETWATESRARLEAKDRAEAAEARVRELEGALQAIRRAAPVESHAWTGADAVRFREIAREALNPPAEDEDA